MLPFRTTRKAELAFRLLLELRASPMSPQMTVARATSQKRIEANRKNAQRSTGPRTPEGKNRSRFNGLKHGLAAKAPVIPGEDPAAYQARLGAMIESCAPQNQVELDSLGRLVATQWTLDRAARAEAALIRYRIRNEAIERERREQDEAILLGQRLFWDARGAWQSYPHRPQTGFKNDTLTSQPQDPGNANTPALQIARLKRTVAGCRWLLDRWAELLARLEPPEVWNAQDQFKSIRLLGKQPLDAVDDPEVTLICLASAKLLPDGDKFDPFAAIKNELQNYDSSDRPCEYITYSRELSKRSFAQLRPADAHEAREALRALVDRQTARLKLILARNQEIAEADAAEAPDRLAFDPSPEGEKLRRYILSAGRLANQTIQAFLSVARCPLSVNSEYSDAAIENVGGDVLAPEGDGGNPFAEPKATMGDASAEASRRELRPDPNAPPAASPPSTSFTPEPPATAPLRTEPNATPAASPPPTSFSPDPSATAPLRTEPNVASWGTPPASFNPEPPTTATRPTELNAPTPHPEPVSLNPRTSGTPNFPRPSGESPGATGEGRVRGSENGPKAPATAPQRTEPNTPPTQSQPPSWLIPELFPDGPPGSEEASLKRYNAVLHSLYPPHALKELTPSERAEVNKYRKALHASRPEIAGPERTPPG
jgi:hypothetical protein